MFDGKLNRIDRRTSIFMGHTLNSKFGNTISIVVISLLWFVYNRSVSVAGSLVQFKPVCNRRAVIRDSHRPVSGTLNIKVARRSLKRLDCCSRRIGIENKLILGNCHSPVHVIQGTLHSNITCSFTELQILSFGIECNILLYIFATVSCFLVNSNPFRRFNYPFSRRSYR